MGKLEPTLIAFADAHKEFIEAYEWLSERKVIHAQSRLSQYTEVLKEVANCRDENDYKKIGEYYGAKTFNAAAFEGLELVEIYRSLKLLMGRISGDRLIKIISGPLSYADENLKAGGNQARDIIFELYIAAELAKHGFDVYLDEDADVLTYYRGYKIYIECKRAQSAAQIPKLIKKAYKQLNNRYKESSLSEKPRGIAVISLTKIINSGLKYLQASSLLAARTRIKNEVSTHYLENQREILHRRDKKTVALWLQARVPIHTPETGGGFYTYQKFYPLSSQSTEAVQFYQELIKGLGAHNP